MKKVVVILAVLSLAVCISTAASARALDYIDGSYVDNPLVVHDVTLNSEVGGEYVYLSNTPVITTPRWYNAAQPNITYGNFTGNAICIDWERFLGYNGVYDPIDNPNKDAIANPGYQVYSWANALSLNKIGQIDATQPNVVWSQLTTMWTLASVITPTDRAALQAATWKVCNANLSITGWNPAHTDFATRYAQYVEIATKQTSDSYRNNFVILADANHKHQTLVTAVPEASTLVGFGSALMIAGPGMIGWLKRRRV
jgi:hypothetical protein